MYFLLTVLAQGVILQNHISQSDLPKYGTGACNYCRWLGIYTCKYWFIISVRGAWLGWTLLAGELPFIVAKDGLFPKWFAKEIMEHL
ncbi:hypothetical protein ACVPOS_03675 [Staphylococcus aureus]